MKSLATWTSNGGFTQVLMGGANDIEAWGTTDGTAIDYTYWFDGFESSSGSYVDNFGAANGCPTTITTIAPLQACGSGGWVAVGYYDVSGYWAGTMATPEIYYNGCTYQGQY